MLGSLVLNPLLVHVDSQGLTLFGISLTDYTPLVGIIKVRKDFYMNVNSLNTVVLVYILVAVITVGVILMIFLGNGSQKKP